LVGFSSDPEHDWHYLLGTMHMLPLDTLLAFLIRVAAFAIGAASLAFAVWLLNEMRKPRVRQRIAVPRARPRPEPDAVAKWDEVSKPD